MRLDEEAQKLGFYTTVFIEAQDQESAELEAMELLRNDPKLSSGALNTKLDSPMMFVEKSEELESFKGLNLPRTGFSFFPEEKEMREV